MAGDRASHLAAIDRPAFRLRPRRARSGCCHSNRRSQSHCRTPLLLGADVRLRQSGRRRRRHDYQALEPHCRQAFDGLSAFRTSTFSIQSGFRYRNESSTLLTFKGATTGGLLLGGAATGTSLCCGQSDSRHSPYLDLVPAPSTRSPPIRHNMPQVGLGMLSNRSLVTFGLAKMPSRMAVYAVESSYYE